MGKTPWTRPPGPARVWRTIEAVDSTGRIRKFSIQEITDDRYDEAVEHMCDVYLRDELLCSTLDMTSEPASVDFWIKLWNLCLRQGISIGAYEITGGDDQSVLAAVAVLVSTDDEIDDVVKAIMKSSLKVAKMINFIEETYTRINHREIYEGSRYLGGTGLSVDPDYRRLGLARQLLEVRSDVCRAYGFDYTTSLFTIRAAHRAAEAAGYQTDLERVYDDAVDDRGNLAFPKLKGLSCKIMGKQISH